MSLDLDDRQRAMLSEMGIPVWLPRTEPVADETQVVSAPAVQMRSATPAVSSALKPDQRSDQKLDSTNATLAPTPAETSGLDWLQLEQAMAASFGGDIEQARRNGLLGSGDRAANWVMVGEAPGETEDVQGDPMVGQAGKLLDNMLRSVALDRDRIFMVNVLKRADEKASCDPFLRRQIELVRPKVIVAMGRFAAQSVLADSAPQSAELPLGKLRGQLHSFQSGDSTTPAFPVVVTYHPAYLLRSLTEKTKAWADLCLALSASD